MVRSLVALIVRASTPLTPATPRRDHAAPSPMLRSEEPAKGRSGRGSG